MKQTFLIGAIGLALTGFFGYHTIYARQQERVRVIQAQIAARQADRKAQEDVAALLAQFEKYRQGLPDEPDPSWLANKAMTIGQRAGLELTTISQESPQPFQQFTRLTVKLEFTATYHQVGTFLDELERSGHFIRVDALELGAPSSAGGAGKVYVLLSTFYVPDASELLAASPTVSQ